MNDILSAVIPDPRPIEEKLKDYSHTEKYGGLPVTWVEKPSNMWSMPSQRNQDGSYSCVMQSSASAIEDMTGQIISALPYKLRNGGGQGMYLQNAADILKNNGAPLESVGPSQNMNDVQIDSATLPSSVVKISGYAFPDCHNIDQIAEAIQAYGNCIIAFGSNSQEWTTEPIYSSGPVTFYHAIEATDYTLFNGVKHLICRDSAGQYSSPAGYRLISEDFLKNRATGAMYYTGFKLANSEPPQPVFKHNFATDIGLGQSGDEVKALQRALKIDGEFPQNTEITGFFGPITQKAVSLFQRKYNVANPLILFFNAGRFVGLATRAALNKLFNV